MKQIIKLTKYESELELQDKIEKILNKAGIINYKEESSFRLVQKDVYLIIETINIKNEK